MAALRLEAPVGFFENLAKNLAVKLLCSQLGPIDQIIEGATTVQELYLDFRRVS